MSITPRNTWTEAEYSDRHYQLIAHIKRTLSKLSAQQGPAAMLKLLLFVFTSGTISLSANAAEWKARIGQGYTLCDALLKRLNGYSYPDAIKTPNNCDWNAALSYPGFREPPWEELEPKRHEALIYRLIKYQWSNGRPNLVLPQQEPFIREQVTAFIEQGGRVQLWRTRLVSDFFNKNHPERWTPSGLQNVVQLRYASTANEKFQQTDACPDIPWAGWRGSLFILNNDVTDVHPNIGLAANSLINRTLVLYRGKPHFISGTAGLNVSLGWDIGGGPAAFCSLEYTNTQSGKE